MHFRDIIDQWPAPSIGTLADDLGFDWQRVKRWHTRDSIYSEHWESIVRAAHARGLTHVTLQSLAHAATIKVKVRRTSSRSKTMSSAA